MERASIYGRIHGAKWLLCLDARMFHSETPESEGT
jgi:hypothetical protein